MCLPTDSHSREKELPADLDSSLHSVPQERLRMRERLVWTEARSPGG